MLDNGTAGPFDLFRQQARVSVAFDSQGAGYYQSILRRGVFEQAFVPEGVRAIFGKGSTV